MSKVIPFDPVKRKVSKDICPKCNGELDTGWECNDCGFDAYEVVHGHPFYGAQCPSYPKCSGGCGLGCTYEIVGAHHC